MRLLFVLLISLLLLLQYSLWVGEGSLAELNALKKQVNAQKAELANLELRNQALKADVKDLREGKDAIEERARMELGMIKKNEVFFQIIPPVAINEEKP